MDDAYRKTKGAIDRPVPGGVTTGQVVVHRDQVDALACKSVEKDGGHGGEGLALTGAHLGDLALMEDDAADHLNVVGPLADAAGSHLAGSSEGFREEVVQGLALVEAVAELFGQPCQFIVR